MISGPGDDEVRAQIQIVCGQSGAPPALARSVPFGRLLRRRSTVQYNFHVLVILKALDQQLVHIRVLSRNDEQVPRSCQLCGLVVGVNGADSPTCALLDVERWVVHNSKHSGGHARNSSTVQRVEQRPREASARTEKNPDSEAAHAGLGFALYCHGFEWRRRPAVRRWGDCSGAVLDPADPSTVWVAQMARARSSYGCAGQTDGDHQPAADGSDLPSSDLRRFRRRPRSEPPAAGITRLIAESRRTMEFDVAALSLPCRILAH